MKFRYDTYCGLYCGACDVIIANEKGTVQETAQKWNMNPEDIECHGCKSGITAVYCKTCEIKQCAEKNEVEFCFHCKEYPCDLLVEFKSDEYPHHSAIFKNLDAIKEEGVLEWLDEQEKRWSCPECGTRFSWYTDVCKKCGSNLYNCKAEEKDIQ